MRITIPLPLVESILVVKIEKCSIAKSCSFLSAPFFGFTSFIATMCGFSCEISSISSHFFVAVNWSAFVYTTFSCSFCRRFLNASLFALILFIFGRLGAPS